MPSALPFHLARALAVLGFLTCTSVDAATLTAISQVRPVAIGGQITIVDRDNGDTFQASLAAGAQTDPGDFSVFDESFGLGDHMLDNALGIGRDAGRAAQTSTLGGQVIRWRRRCLHVRRGDRERRPHGVVGVRQQLRILGAGCRRLHDHRGSGG